MNFILVRVDNRLVHGQILEGWLPSLDASCIITVNDEVAEDIFRESVIRMVVPSDIEFYVYAVDDFAKNCAYGNRKGIKTIVLFKDISDAVKAYRQGFLFDRINIGNVHNDEGLCCISPSTVLNSEEVKYLKDLIEKGVQVTIQSVPRDKPVDFREVAINLDTD